MDWITTIQPWQWLVLGILLLIIETFGVGGFLIGLALASILQSAIAAVWPNLSWDFQLVIFAINAMLVTALYWKFFKRFNQKTDQQNLNNRAAQLIGRKITMSETFPDGEGKVQVGDTFWRFRCNESLGSGDAVEVTGSDGMVLIVEKR